MNKKQLTYCLFFFLLFPYGAFSEYDTVVWQFNGVTVCGATGTQTNHDIASDGKGGVIAVWQDGRSGWQIYAQMIDASGVIQWVANGVPVGSTAGEQKTPRIAPDEDGGAFIVWEDSRSGGWDIYAQKIDASGVAQWTAGGVLICNAVNLQYRPNVVSDGNGGAVIMWQDRRSGGWDIYAQKVNPSGIVEWADTGVAVCTASNDQYDQVIVTDGNGGAIIVWTDNRTGTYDIYAQRVDSAGSMRWTANGAVICNAANVQYGVQIVSDGNGGIIAAWMDYRIANQFDIYAQRIDASGTAKWNANGVAVCLAETHQYNPQITGDGNGGGIIVWEDYRSGISTIYAQRIDEYGGLQWTTDGLALYNGDTHQNDPHIAGDGNRGAVVAWRDHRNGNADIYAQKIDRSGALKWTAGGEAICNTTSGQYNPIIINDGSRGALIAWEDYSAYDIYVQRIYRFNADTVTPASGYVGTALAIKGSGFGSSQGNGEIYFNGIDAGVAEKWSDTEISVITPILPEAGVLGLVVAKNGLVSDTKDFTLSPKIDYISPDFGDAGTAVELKGYAFGTRQNASKVYFGGTEAGGADAWETTIITIKTPAGAVTGDITLTVNGQTSNGKYFTVGGEIFTVEGKITDGNGTPLTGTEVIVSGRGTGEIFAKYATDASGYYKTAKMRGGYYRIRPVKFGYVFVPKEKVYEQLSSNQTVDFGGIKSAQEKKTGVRRNLINPMKGEKATIVFALDANTKVEIKIYNIRGGLVKILTAEEKPSGNHSYEWDGRDDDGNIVGSGVYRVIILMGAYREEQKIVVLK